MLISMYYEPETTGSAPYITDLARCYAAAGHEVQVFTTWPHYPAWRVDRSSVLADEDMDSRITVNRIRTYVPRHPTLGRRLVYEIVFSVVALYKAIRIRRVDLICGCSPNLFSAVAAAIVGRFKRRPVVQFVQDIVSSALVQTDQSESSIAHKALFRLEGWALRAGVLVVAPTDAFKPSLSRLGVDPTRVRTVRNWSRVEAPAVTAPPAKAGVVLHTGNIGQKQALDLLAPDLAVVLERDSRLEFHFVGDGNRRRELQASVSDLSRVFLRDPVPASEYPQLLQQASVLLVHERPGVLDMSLPSKLTSYFAAGRPVVAVVDPDGLTAREITASGAGVVVSHGDPMRLAQVLVSLLDDEARAAAYASAGREYRQRFLTVEAAFASLEAVLDEAMDLAEARAG